MNALLTIGDLCDRYKCSRPVAGRIMHSVPHIKVGKRLLVDEKDLAQWEEDQMRYPAVKSRRSAGPHMIPRRTA